MLRIEPIKQDQAHSAILELIDGPKDMRFAMTARTLAHIREKKHDINEITAQNVEKVTRYRQDGERELEEMVGRFAQLGKSNLRSSYGGAFDKRRVKHVKERYVEKEQERRRR